jgi:DNA-binding transcriptional MerR regulator
MKTRLRPIDLARAVGVSTQTVRQYEELGFLPPAERSSTGHRVYGPRHLQALRTARVMADGYGWQPALHIMRLIHQGDLVAALAAIDARHAGLHQGRHDVEQTLAALRTAAVTSPVLAGTKGAPGRPGLLRVGEAARLVGVRVSAVRFWERQGLLHPRRDGRSRYRLYDRQELRKLQVVALLRKAGYGLDAIRTVLAELAEGRLDRAVAAAERRLKDLAQASRRCAAATAAVWAYLEAVETTSV